MSDYEHELIAENRALRARLAEVEAERDNLAMFHRDWYANDLPEMQRLAIWLDPDPDLPLPNLHNLVTAAMERAAESEARLAEVEQVLGDVVDTWERMIGNPEPVAITRARALVEVTRS